MVDRPKGITYWIFIEIITAIILIGFAIACFTGISYNIYDTSLRAPINAMLAPYEGLRIPQLINLLFSESMFNVWGILTLLIGLSFIGSAVLLYKMQELGRLLSVFNGVFVLLTIVGLILGLLMIWYFRRSKTRSYFP